MKKPVQIHIPEKYRAGTVQKNRCPLSATYKLAFAECNYWKNQDFSIIEQYYDTRDVFFCLAEVHTAQSLRIPINCELNDLYWLCQLKGDYKIAEAQSPQNKFILFENNYSVIDLPAGRYTCRFESGQYLIVYFAIKRKWLLRHQRQQLESIIKILTLVQAGTLKGYYFFAVLEVSERVQRLLLELFCLPTTPALTLDLAIYQRATILMLESLQQIREQYEEDSPGKKIIDEVRTFISGQQEPRNVPPISIIAKHFRTSTSFLLKRHRIYYQTDLQSFINEEKLNYAYRQLTQSHLSISTIAHKSGYLDITNFSRAFKTHFGANPSHIRKQNKGNNNSESPYGK